MLRFEIALTPEAADRFDAVFRVFVEDLGPDAQSDIHQVAFQVMGGERRIVMFETDAQRCLFAKAWDAAAGGKPRESAERKATATPRSLVSQSRPDTFAAVAFG